MGSNVNAGHREPWNKGEIVGQKAPFKLKDIWALRVRDQVASRAVVMQHKTQRPVQFEITPATREAVHRWIKQAGLRPDDFVFPSRIHDSPHLGTRQYARILERWVEELGLDPLTTAPTRCGAPRRR
jgi:integrase